MSLDVYFFPPEEVGTTDVTSCVTTYTLRRQDPHNPGNGNIPHRYETVKAEEEQLAAGPLLHPSYILRSMKII